MSAKKVNNLVLIMKKILTASSFLFLFPVVASAQTFGDGLSTYFGGIVTFINGTLVPIIFAIAFLAFLWGVVKYFILGGGDEDKRKEGKQLMLYAIIGFVLMISVWGIVNLLASGLGLNDNDVELPTSPTGFQNPGGAI